MTDVGDRPITPVILSGGSGTRLWPLSTAERPKQFHALVGAQTMFEMTVRRVADPSVFLAPVIVASHRHAALVEEGLEHAQVGAGRIILEPVARNTAAAIALAAFASEPDEFLLVTPSDHLITHSEAFIDAVRAARSLAQEGWLVTFGIRPNRAETGYGYIRHGDRLSAGVYRADEFIEKPDSETAESFLNRGGYEWNSGIFLLRADAYLDALQLHDPGIFAASREAMRLATIRDIHLHPDPEALAVSPSRSIDHAVMERAQRVAVMPIDIGWSDVGSWDALYEQGVADRYGNVVDGRGQAIESEGCLLRSSGPSISALGIKDLIVVASPDNILIMPRGSSQRVKELADAKVSTTRS